ncbi:MAG: ACP phosphodiesterase, partial [Chromatocurvus sp.]
HSFTLEVYDAMHQNPLLLPTPVRALAPEMIARDFLNRCETFDGVLAVLSHIEARLSRGFDLRTTRQALEEHDAALEQGFARVFFDVHHVLGSGPIRT